MPADAELAEYIDRQRGLMRLAAFRSGRLDGCIFVGPTDTPPQWNVVRALFASGTLAERERRVLLSGRGADGMVETGPVICACFGVGLAAIRAAVAGGQAATVAISVARCEPEPIAAPASRSCGESSSEARRPGDRHGSAARLPVSAVH